MFCIHTVWLHWAAWERGRFCIVLPTSRISYCREEKGRLSRQLKYLEYYLVSLFQQGEGSCWLTGYRAVLKASDLEDTLAAESTNLVAPQCAF